MRARVRAIAPCLYAERADHLRARRRDPRLLSVRQKHIAVVGAHAADSLRKPSQNALSESSCEPISRSETSSARSSCSRRFAHFGQRRTIHGSIGLIDERDQVFDVGRECAIIPILQVAIGGQDRGDRRTRDRHSPHFGFDEQATKPRMHRQSRIATPVFVSELASIAPSDSSDDWARSTAIAGGGESQSSVANDRSIA